MRKINLISLSDAQDEKGFIDGDMYDYRNKKTDFEVYICEDDFVPKFIEFYLSDYKLKFTEIDKKICKVHIIDKPTYNTS